MNPKAQYFKNANLPASPDEWAKGAEEVKGSWWPRWAEWLSERSGIMKTAPKTLGSEAFPPLYPSPGKYVFD
jgi:polyhydroxyalkanoate synthase